MQAKQNKVLLPESTGAGKVVNNKENYYIIFSALILKKP